MNHVLQLKGTFNKRKHPRAVVVSTLPSGRQVTSSELKRLESQLKKVLESWVKDNLIGGALVSVHYKRIVPKSRRISYLFKYQSAEPGDCICGARFENSDQVAEDKEFRKKHVFTYFISLDSIRDSILKIEQCIDIIDNYYAGMVSAEDISQINQGNYAFHNLSKSVFTGIVVDCSEIDYIAVDTHSEAIQEGSLITLYKTKYSTKDVLRKIGIDITDQQMLGDNTVRLYQDEIDLLLANAPYLVAMLDDFSKYDIGEPVISKEETEIRVTIPEPKDEPYIGVIDTHFDESVYFHKWVDYQNKMDQNLDIEGEDYFHGTAVASLIVDGPRINPELEDGCGRFRVRLFGVAKNKGASSFAVLRQLKTIIRENPDIKVWNLSLGSVLEVPENYISPEAAILDRIQSEYDVIFVIAGTNDHSKSHKKRIGAPADSINSIVVNAVNSDGKEASYARKGPVLGFFYKPDISCYGGDTDDYMRVCGPLGEAKVTGTSFAAPWVTRKIAFMIYKMGLSRELAKALLIDASAGWNRQDGTAYTIGYGVVPTHINDILKTRNDEIRFIVSGTLEEYETYTYTIPVPIHNHAQPFWARATLIYFPSCDRNQGVDYTSTEVDLHFGRVHRVKDRVELKEINDNRQAKEGLEKIYEADARQIYRKWDNVKYIAEIPKRNARPKKVYEAGMWGLRIVTKERGSQKLGRGMNFGVVVTLREMNGVNRIDEFTKLCGLYGWYVTPIDIDASMDIYNRLDGDITWE